MDSILQGTTITQSYTYTHNDNKVVREGDKSINSLEEDEEAEECSIHQGLQ